MFDTHVLEYKLIGTVNFILYTNTYANVLYGGTIWNQHFCL